MSATFQFELVSPERIVISKPSVLVTIPGGEGVYGVLPGHAPMITTVKAGVIELYADNENTVSERIFVAGGFAEVAGDRCTVLAEEAVAVSDLDKAALEQASKDCVDDVAAAKTDEEKVTAEEKLALVNAKLAALQ